MRSVRVIPCLDVDRGRVVKGVRFLDVVDSGSPVELAARYGEEGADEVVFLDVTASVEGRKTMLSVVEATADQVFIPFTVGGGVRTLDDARALLRAGADKVALNSAALERPGVLQEISGELGAQCVVIAIDARRRDRGWGVWSHGARHETAWGAVEWAEHAASLGAGEVLLTSIDRDGTRAGYDLELVRAVSRAVSVPVIASGGVGTLEHLSEAAAAGADAVLAASIFHQQTFTIGAAKAHLRAEGVSVRPFVARPALG